MKARIPKGPNMQDMLKQAQQMQENLANVQAEVESREFTAGVGGGMVEATVTGKHQIVKLDIKPDVVDPEDIEMLSDLITGAVNEAMRKADEAMDTEMGKVQSIDGLNIPGLM